MVTLIRHASRRLQNEFVPIALTCKWWTVRESNPVPSNYEFDALTCWANSPYGDTEEI